MKSWMLVLVVTAASIGAEVALTEPSETGMRESAPKPEPAPRSRAQVELDLKLARADSELVRKGADLDEKRRIFAKIIEDHGPVIDPTAPLPDDAVIPAEPVALTLPVREKQSAEMFLKEGSEFLVELRDACCGGARTADELDEARVLHAEMLEDESVKGLLAQMADARAEIDAMTRSEAESVPPEEESPPENLEELPLDNRIEVMLAEVDREFAGTRGLDDLDELRAAKAPVFEYAAAEREKERAKGPLPLNGYIGSRIQELEEELAKLEIQGN